MSEPLVSINVQDTRQLPEKLRVVAATFPYVTMTVTAKMARDVARVVETGLNAAADQERLLAEAEKFRVQSLGQARAVLDRAEAQHAEAGRKLAAAQANLRASFLLCMVSAALTVAALLGVLA